MQEKKKIKTYPWSIFDSTFFKEECLVFFFACGDGACRLGFASTKMILKSASLLNGFSTSIFIFFSS